MPAAPAFGRAPNEYIGSAYRHGEILKQLCELRVLAADDRRLPGELHAADFAVVRADRFTQYQLARRAGVPYLVLCNDLATMRDPQSEFAECEREMLEGAAAVIFVTAPLRGYAVRRYALPPHEVIPLRPLARDLRFKPLPKVPRSLVYAGNVCTSRYLGGPWAYRVNVEIFRAASRAGWQVHVYPSRLRFQVEHEYSAAGCVVHDHLPERELTRELSRYTAGLQVFNTRCVPEAALAYARLAWPNKTWLYQAAGIPTVGCNPGFEACRIYEGRWGIVLHGPEEFAALTEEQLPAIDAKLRASETIDSDLPRFRRLIEAVTSTAPLRA